MILITIVHGGYKPANITGWPHIVDHLGDLMEFNQTIYEYF